MGSRLPFDNNGTLYGATASGRTASRGTLFQLAPPTVEGGAWTENVLYSFAGGTDGCQPGMNVVFDHIAVPLHGRRITAKLQNWSFRAQLFNSLADQLCDSAKPLAERSSLSHLVSCMSDA